MAITQRMIPAGMLRGIDIGEMATIDAADPGSKDSYRARNIEVNPKYAMHPMDVQKTTDCRGPDADVVGAEMGDLSFEIPLRAGKLAAGGLDTSNIIDLLQYMGASCNKRPLAAADVVSANAGDITVTVAASGDYVTGDMFMVKGSGTDPQMRVITDVADAAPNTVWTVYPDFTDVPANGDTIYAVDTIIPATGAPSKYFGADVYLGQGTTNRFLANCLGMAGTWVLPSTNAGDVPWLQIKMMMDRFTLSESNRAQTADLFDPPWPILSSKCWFGDDNIDIASIGFDPGLVLAEKHSTAGANGRVDFQYDVPVPVLEVLPYHSNDFYTFMGAGTTKQFFFESTVDETQSWALFCGAVQIIDITRDATPNEHVSSKLNLKCIDPGVDAHDEYIPIYALGLIGNGP